MEVKNLSMHVNSFKNYVSTETLAESLISGEIKNGTASPAFQNKQDWKIGEFDCTIQIEKVSFK